MGCLFLGEVVTWQIGIGCAVILIASIVIFRERKYENSFNKAWANRME